MASELRARICDLPNEVLVSIFSFLTIRDLARVAATCEQWHGIVTSFPHLWRGRPYRSYCSPAHCPETRAVLRALPPFPRITIESAMSFMVKVRYPHLVLHVKNINVMKDLPRLRCEFLWIRLDIAGDIFTKKTSIDFGRLRQLRILEVWDFNFWAPRVISVDYVVRWALLLCPNLSHLSLRTDFVSGECLETVDGLDRLKNLEIISPGVWNLSFLRHCSDALEGLVLDVSGGLDPHELVHVGRLRNLRKLWLGGCQFSEGDVAAAFAGLASLESLHLNCCSPIRDLSIVRHCRRLRKLSINTSLSDNLLPSAVQELQLGGLVPCTDAVDRHLGPLMSVTVNAENLSVALSRLQDRGLGEISLAYLAALRPCSELRNLYWDFTSGPDERERLNVRIHISLSSSE